MSHIVNFAFEEVTFGVFHLQSCFFQPVEDDFQVLQMFQFIVTEDNDIIEVCHCEIESLKNLVHK